jgi:hypothetical protein
MGGINCHLGGISQRVNNISSMAIIICFLLYLMAYGSKINVSCNNVKEAKTLISMSQYRKIMSKINNV